MFLFCSNQVVLAVFKYIVCTNKLLVQSLVYTYQKVVICLFNFSPLTISFLYSYQNVLTWFLRTNVLNSRKMFSILEQCS